MLPRPLPETVTREGGKQVAKVTTKGVIKTAANPVGIASDIAQTGLEAGGYKEKREESGSSWQYCFRGNGWRGSWGPCRGCGGGPARIRCVGGRRSDRKTGGSSIWRVSVCDSFVMD